MSSSFLFYIEKSSECYIGGKNMLQIEDYEAELKNSIIEDTIEHALKNNDELRALAYEHSKTAHAAKQLYSKWIIEYMRFLSFERLSCCLNQNRAIRYVESEQFFDDCRCVLHCLKAYNELA